MAAMKYDVDQINPELFLYELYDSQALVFLDSHDLAAFSVGYCDAGRLAVRPKSGLLALMVEYPNGDRCWFHIEPKMLESINRRRGRIFG